MSRGCVFCISALALAATLPARAAEFSVDSTVDAADLDLTDGACSAIVATDVDPITGLPSFEFGCTLRSAVQQANETPEQDTVLLPPGTYVLDLGSGGEDAAAEGDLDVTEDLVLEAESGGPSGTVIALSGSLADPVIEVLGSSFLDPMTGLIVSGTRLELVGLTVTEGLPGIRNEGLLEVRDARISDNRGIGLVNDGGGATLERTEVSGNGFLLGGGGGGIRNLGSNILLGATVTLRQSAVVDNSGATGGITNLAGVGVASLLVENSTLSGNSHFLDIEGGGGSGGGISQGTSGEATPQAVLRNATLTANDAAGSGGGIAVSAGSVDLANSVVEGNTASGSGPDCSGSIDSSGHNWIGATAGCSFSQQPTDVLDQGDAMLGPLQGNGGPTDTHRPQPGSPLIDDGDSDGCTNVTGDAFLMVDQRGELRPEDGDGDGTAVCDVGAVEFVPEPRALVLAAVALGTLSVLGGSRNARLVSRRLLLWCRGGGVGACRGRAQSA